jgi:hypothetical protein
MGLLNFLSELLLVRSKQSLILCCLLGQLLAA